jgi:hypothetical protein
MTRTRTLLALFPALAAAACGPEQPGPAAPAASAAPVAKQEVVKNLGYLDISTLFPAPPVVPGHATQQALLGVELAARPMVLECLVDPKNRGADKKTHVVVDAALTDAGVDHQVTGENLTPAGTACIQAALAAWTGAVPTLSAKNAPPGGAPVKSHIEFEHQLGSTPAVEMGINDVSDVAGAIRLGLPHWADCFGDWKGAAPRTLKATVKVVHPAADAGAVTSVTPAEVTFDPSSDAAAGKAAACLADKIKALQVKVPQGQSISLPYTFHFVHSGIAEALPDAPPDVQLVQIDLQRARRTADVLIAEGDRTLAAVVYDDVVKRYKAKTKPAPSVADLKARCQELLATDDKLIAAAGKRVASEDAAHTFTAAQKAQDATWTEAEAKAAQSLAGAQKDAQTYASNRAADEAACPKVK